MPKKLAVFDFDHTLIVGDSLWPFLTHAAGATRATRALAQAAADLIRARLRRDPGDDSARDFIKADLLRRLLAGQTVAALRPAAIRTRDWQTEKAAVMRELRRHHARGDIVVIASGGLDLYLPECLRDIPHHALICTEIGVENGIVTGIMTRGNCVRRRKAERLAEWMAANGPFDETFGYGNHPHDRPMLELLQHRTIIR